MTIIKNKKINKAIQKKRRDMKNNSLKIADFQSEKISRNTQKTIKGGDPLTSPEEPNPLKNGGGGNG